MILQKAMAKEEILKIKQAEQEESRRIEAKRNQEIKAQKLVELEMET